MSRRNDLLSQLIASKKFGKEKEQEQKFITATAELILSDLINIAITGVEKQGAGVLIINLMNDSTTYMSSADIEKDLAQAESDEDEKIISFLRDLLSRIDKNDWSKNVLITLISHNGTRTFEVEAGRSQASLRALAEEFSG